MLIPATEPYSVLILVPGLLPLLLFGLLCDFSLAFLARLALPAEVLVPSRSFGRSFRGRCLRDADYSSLEHMQLELKSLVKTIDTNKTYGGFVLTKGAMDTHRTFARFDPNALTEEMLDATGFLKEGLYLGCIREYVPVGAARMDPEGMVASPVHHPTCLSRHIHA